jgi:glycosyltransferase involved in cell wall biosynthesis
MRILISQHNLFECGATQVTFDRARRWAEAGHEVDLLVVEPLSRWAATPPDNISVVYGGRIGMRRKVMWARSLQQAILLARRADVVVSGLEIGPGLTVAAVAARLTRKPLSVTVQSNIIRALDAYVGQQSARRFVKWALRQADLLVCVSEALARDSVRYGSDRTQSRAVLNGIEVDAIRLQAQMPPAIPLPQAPFIIGMGRLHPQKGFDILLKAHAEALARGAPAHRLLILGEGPQRAELEALIETLDIAGTAMLAGFGRREPAPIIAAASLFVLTSRWEGLPLVLLEAMGLETPIVATDCPTGAAEILEGGRFGRLVPVGDVAAIAEAIHDHLARPEALRDAICDGATICAERFSPAQAALQHLSLLEELAQGRQH